MRSSSFLPPLLLAVVLGLPLTRTAEAAIPRCDVLLASGGSISAGVAATPSGGTLCLGAGAYSLSASVVVSASITITGYPQQDPIASPALMPAIAQASGFTMFSVRSNGVTIEYLAATGTGKATAGSPATSCSGPQFFSTDTGAWTDPTASFNWIKDFNCAINFNNGPARPVANGNFIQGSAYTGINCVSCVGDSGQTTWTVNLIYNNGYGSFVGGGFNSYPIVYSGPGGSPSTNMTSTGNSVIFDPQWQCYDTHGGTNIRFNNNFCLAPGHDSGINMPVASSSGATNPIVNLQANGNVIDLGSMPLVDSVVMCSDSGCGSSLKVTGGQIVNNRMRMGAGNGCVIAASPPVTVSGNNGATPCNSGNGLAPERVASITLSNFADGTPNAYTSGQPNRTIATINVNMTGADWAFPTPPGTLAISGANSCGLRVVGNQLVQALAGSPNQACNDFSIVATLSGMAGSPFTQGGFSLNGPPPGFYVATTGNDSNPGSFASPFLTLGKCQTTIRTNSPKVCYLRAGTYTLPAAGLHLTSSDINESWGVYPPDGNGSAILSGASLNPTTFAIQTDSGATGVSFNGLKITDGSYIVVFSQGSNTSWTNNIIDGLGTNPWYGLDIYGDNLLVASNTIQNLNGSEAFGIFFNLTGTTNSSIRNNVIQCNSHYGMYVGLNTTATIFANNQILGIGHVGGSPPGCGTLVDGSGTGIDADSSNGNLYVGNTIQDVEGYTIVVNNSGGANFIDGNSLQTNSDPVITLNGGPSTVIVHNTLAVPSSIGLNLGDENDNCPRPNTSNGLFVANNTITSGLEPIVLTSTQGSTIQGNIGGIGIQTISGNFPHYKSGISVLNWTQDHSAPCAPVQNNTSNTIRLNSFTSIDAAASYGAFFETAQCGNTLAYNIFWHFGTPGVAAIQNNCGGSQTLTGNQVTSDASPLNAAPPIANAGAGSLAAIGQGVTLDGSGSRLISGGSSGITYAWAQLTGPAVTIASASSIQASFVAPSVAKPTIMSFQLTATNGNGSTTDKVYIGVDPSL